MNGFPYIFTFYSFKGGVGRSMALLNTAYTLAGWGKHVLMVDLDLEAPGVSSFLERHKELNPAGTETPRDVLDLLRQVVNAARTGDAAPKIARELPPLPSYLRSVSAKKLKKLKPKLGQMGRLDILGADLNRNWCERLATLGLTGLPQEQLAVASDALHLYFKKHRFPFRPLGLEDFEPDQPTPYDYILIDSRTGITEIGGLCVGPLADRLIVLCSLNDQNIEGTGVFLREIGLELKARNSKSQPWDEVDVPDHETLETLGPKPTLLVASPVPNGELEAKSRRINALAKKFGVRAARLSYHPQMALLETVFVRDWSGEYLALEYIELAKQLTQLVWDDPEMLAYVIQDEIDSKSIDSGTLARALRLTGQDATLAKTLLTSLGDSFGSVPGLDLKLVRRIHAVLAGTRLFRDVAMYNLGLELSAEADRNQGELADQHFQAAVEKFAEALRVKPGNNKTIRSWGNTLFNWAWQKQGEKSINLFVAAAEKYAEALRIKPGDSDTLFAWGNALFKQAELKQGDEANRLYSEACEKYAESLSSKPDNHQALFNWGVTLYSQAANNEGEVASRLLLAAANKHDDILRLKNCDPSAFLQLARFHAFQGHLEKSMDCLNRWKSKSPEVSRQPLAHDADFDPIRSTPEFQAFLASLPSEASAGT